MPRTARSAPGGYVFHVFNRGVAGRTLFDNDLDYAAFLACLAKAQAEVPGVRVFAYCLMPDHWHLVLQPARDGELAAFMLKLTITHVRRWLEFHGQVGTGHLYRGRYKSFVCQDDSHLLTLCRHVERSPVRGKLVRKAELWPWCSLAARQAPPSSAKAPRRSPAGRSAKSSRRGPAVALPAIALAPWPIPCPKDWLGRVNATETPEDLAALNKSLSTGRPFGDPRWLSANAKALGWTEPRPRGRPRKILASRK